VIRLCYSNRFEALLDALAAELGTSRRSLFDPVHLVVPNALVEGRVKEGLARRLGVAANVQARFLHHFLRDVAATATPEVTIVDREAIELALLSLFHDPPRLTSRDLGAVRDYLGPGARGDARIEEAGRDRRRVQLALALAKLFDEYAFSRPDMLAAWREGRLLEGDDGALALGEAATLQRWQRELWLALFGRQGVFPTRSAVTLPAYFDTYALRGDGASLRAPAAPLPSRVHVFGMSFSAKLYRTIFAALARVMAVDIYALNPCREYWEDLEPRRRRAPDGRFPQRQRKRQLTLGFEPPASTDPSPVEVTAAADAGDPALLALWGKPGRDSIRLLNELSGCTFEERFVDPTEGAARPTLLATLQREILDRAPGPATRDTSDGSVVIVPAPDPRRELETVAAEIWARLRADEERDDGGRPPLRLSDFAVIVPPAAAPTYLPLVRSVFHEASGLPHTIVDLPPAGERRILEAIELLLAVPDGGLGRRELLRLAMHPAVSGRFPDVDPADWPALCEALTIVRGADAGDHDGSYLAEDRLSWDQGLKRLALGAFLSGPRSGEERPFVLDGQPVLSGEVAPATEAAARALGETARTLIAFARAAAAGPAPIATFTALLRRTIAEVIRPAPEEEAALGASYAALDRLGETAPPDLIVSFRVLADLVRARLGGSAPSRPRAPEGVAVSTFAPMRALPFRTIFVVGLDEGIFPGSDRFEALDLRALDRRPDDVTPRAQDQYLFLETLLAARERLVLSYVARNALTGEARGPSSVVRALQAALTGDAREADPDAALVGPRPPLLRHLDDGACAVIPAAARERQADALGRSLRRAAGAVQLPAFGELRAMLGPGVWDALAPRLGWLPGGAPPPATERTSRAVTLADLRRFLECPLQGSVESLLGLDADEADGDAEAALREYEALDEARVETVPMLREAFVRAIAAGGSDGAALAAAYDALAERRRVAGRLPAGLFGAATRTRHLELLGIWRRGLDEAGWPLPLALAPLWLGQAPEHQRDARRLPPLILAPAAAGAPAIQLFGRTELLGTVEDEPAVVVLGARVDDSALPFYEMLRIWVTQLALAASGAPAPRRALTLRLDKDGRPRVNRFALAPLTATEARERLGALAAEMSAVHPYLLPCEGIFTWRRRQLKQEAMSVRAAVLMVRDDGMTRLSSDRGPVPDPRRYPVPANDEAEAMVARRFTPLFEAFSSERGGSGE
jgi:exodeoxyribonuclease V gamma subunit